METEKSVVLFYYNKAHKNLACILVFCIATCIVFFCTFKGIENLTLKNIIIAIQFTTLLGLPIIALFFLSYLFKNWLIGIIATFLCVSIFLEHAISFVETYKISNSIQEGIFLVIGLVFLFWNIIAYIINRRRYRLLIKGAMPQKQTAPITFEVSSSESLDNIIRGLNNDTLAEEEPDD